MSASFELVANVLMALGLDVAAFANGDYSTTGDEK